MSAELFGLICAAVVVAAVLFAPARRWMQRRREAPAWLTQRAEWQAKFEADNPIGPAFDDAEIVEFARWLAERALPCVALTPDTEATPGERGCYLGGPAWLAPDQAWPADADGVPMEFLAQIDFAALPALPDFPERGVLQLFVQQDDIHGADFDDPRRSVLTALWQPEPIPRRVAHAQPLAAAPVSPLFDAARRDGVVLRPGSASVMQPQDPHWEIAERIKGQLRRPGFERIDGLLHAAERQAPFQHQVGGYPVFVQHDPRRAGFADDYDRVLLRLTSDDHVQWGDVGEANFLIRAQDLRDRNFSRIAFVWDCS